MSTKAHFKYLVIILPFLLLACQTEITSIEETETLDPEIEKLKQILVERGFPENLIVYHGEFFLVDGDISISKKHIQSYLKNSSENSKSGVIDTKQANGIHGNMSLVSLSNITNITVAPATDVPSTWKTALQEGINNWNSTPSRVNFVYQAQPGNEDVSVVIETPFNPESYWAEAELPLGGNPGATLRINLEKSQPADAALEKEEIMTHELGHIIGFAHTDWVSEGVNAFNIPYTPTTDGNSVMNSGSGGLRNWDNFSSNDLNAIKVLYPISLNQPTVIAQSSSVTGFFLNVDLSISYGWGTQVTIEAKENNGSWNYAGTVNYPLLSKSISLPIMGTSGTYYFRIKSKSYHGDIYSSYSNTESVSYQVSGGGF